MQTDKLQVAMMTTTAGTEKSITTNFHLFDIENLHQRYVCHFGCRVIICQKPTKKPRWMKRFTKTVDHWIVGLKSISLAGASSGFSLGIK